MFILRSAYYDVRQRVSCSDFLSPPPPLQVSDRRGGDAQGLAQPLQHPVHRDGQVVAGQARHAGQQQQQRLLHPHRQGAGHRRGALHVHHPGQQQAPHLQRLPHCSRWGGWGDSKDAAATLGRENVRSGFCKQALDLKKKKKEEAENGKKIKNHLLQVLIMQFVIQQRVAPSIGRDWGFDIGERNLDFSVMGFQRSPFWQITPRFMTDAFPVARRNVFYGAPTCGCHLRRWAATLKPPDRRSDGPF